jgi:hypothetical protein
MKNTILFQNELYTVIDISTKTHPKVQTIVDNSSLEKIGNNKVYAFMLTQKVLTARIFGKTYLHRFLVDATSLEEVDHKDGNPLVNILSNLRKCSHEENGRNKHTSTIKGAAWHKRDKCYTCSIRFKNKLIYLGSFKTEKESSDTYNKAAKILFGEFANTNKTTS